MGHPLPLPRSDKPVTVSAPEDWRCGTCGGQLAAETVGMFAGRRWVHTCGVPATGRQRDPVTPYWRDRGMVEPIQMPDPAVRLGMDGSNAEQMTLIDGEGQIIGYVNGPDGTLVPFRRAALEAAGDRINVTPLEVTEEVWPGEQ